MLGHSKRSLCRLLMVHFFGWGFGLGGGRGRGWVGLGPHGRGSHGPMFLGRHISGATSGILEHLILWPVWHFTGAHGAQSGGPRDHGGQSGGTPSGGLSAIISTKKIRIKIFRIISTNYFWISMLNVKYQMYPISNYNRASSYGVLVPEKNVLSQNLCIMRLAKTKKIFAKSAHLQDFWWKSA